MVSVFMVLNCSLLCEIKYSGKATRKMIDTFCIFDEFCEAFKSVTKSIMIGNKSKLSSKKCVCIVPLFPLSV